MSRSECTDRAKLLLQRLELADVMDRKLATYSTGMRQRLSLARALLHRPQILFLDEPTSGLDPESAQNVNALIQEQAAEGITVFLCTHQLRYAQEICTTYGLMNKGRLGARCECVRQNYVGGGGYPQSIHGRVEKKCGTGVSDTGTVSVFYL